MADPEDTNRPKSIVPRLASTSHNASSGRDDELLSPSGDSVSSLGQSSSESPRARYQGRLRELATGSGIPLTLPKPLLSLPSQRAVPQGPSDKPGAEAYLMSLRRSRFLVGKSSKGFSHDEVMQGLDQAVKDDKSAPLVEALLQFAESSTINANSTNSTFTAGKKGHVIPTIDYVFGQTTRFDVWQLFLGRISQRARDNTLAGALRGGTAPLTKVRALLEWGANPELCQEQILDLVALADSEELVEILLLSRSLRNLEFLSQALIHSISARSLRNASMLLLRGADANFSHGEALKRAVSAQCYDIVLAIVLLSTRPVSPSILDEAVGQVVAWHRDIQKPFLLVLLYSGACGLQTSRAVTTYIAEQDGDVSPILVDSFAFGHGSFPSPKLFQAAVEAKDSAMAIRVLQSSKNRSFSDYARTGVHLQLIQSYGTNADGSLDVVSEFLALGSTGDFASQMLVKCCEAEQIGNPDILTLINILVHTGGAKATYADGRCLYLAIEAIKPEIVKALMSARPAKKMLSAAVAYTNSFVDDQDPSKLEIWSTLMEAGASGQVIDQQLVIAIDRTSWAMDKVKVLLRAASLDYSEGEAIVKAIQVQRLDILQALIGRQKPQTSMPSVWKQTRQIFNIAKDPPYSLLYMQQIFGLLHNTGTDSGSLDDLLHDATQCLSHEVALNLSSLFLRWGASPDHALGAPLIACVKRSDTKTLGALLSHNPSKTSLKYAFEEALLLQGRDRYETTKMIIGAGLEDTCLDAALPSLLRAEYYDSPTVHLLVASGGKLHSSFAQNLVAPAKALDLQIVETLIPKSDKKTHGLLPLKGVLSSHSDWQRRDGPSLPMVKFLLTQLDKGTWADRLFITQVKALNQHSTNLFIDHLTTKQIISEALHELLSLDKGDFSREKLSMTIWLLDHGAEGDEVDAEFLLAAQQLKYEWIVALNARLNIPDTRLLAFEAMTSHSHAEVPLQGKRLEIVQFLLRNGLRAPAVDGYFIKAAAAGNIKGVHDFLPSVSANATFSEALEALNKNIDFAFTEKGQKIIKILVKNGASGVSVLRCAEAAGRSCSLTGVELIAGVPEHRAACKAAFDGLLDGDDLLASTESRTILRFLIGRGLDHDDAKRVATIAASKQDIALMADIIPAGNQTELCNAALETFAAIGSQWLSTKGLSFLNFVIGKGTKGPILLSLIETAAKSTHLPALRLLHELYDDRVQAANAAFVALTCDEKVPSSPEELAVMDFVLKEGAKSVAVQNTAAKAARTSKYEALEIFLKSPAAASIIPAAFKAVTRDNSGHLSSEQLSIASIIVKQGVPTEVLVIAAVETAKLLDLEALKVLSQSSRFAGVTDDTLRALLLDEDLWRSLKGLRIMQYLFEVGVSFKSIEVAASKAALALDRDALQLIFDSNDSPEIVDVAFASLAGADDKWLSPDGLRIVDFLIQKSPSQANVDKAFIQASQHLNHDAVKLLHSHVTDVSVFNSALAGATSTGTAWLLEPRLIEQLLNSCVDGEVIESALIKSAQAQGYGCLELLSARVDRWEVYTKALSATRTNRNWRQYVRIIEFLLDRGAQGQPVEEAYIAAAGDLDYRLTLLLGSHIDDADVDCRAFTAATTGDSWLFPGHVDLLEFLLHRNIPSKVLQPALNSAAKALNVPAIEALAKNANEKLASEAFASAVSSGIDWTSAEGSLVLKILAQKGARGDAVAQAMISSAGQMRLDLLEVLLANVDNKDSQSFSAALNAMITRDDSWLSRPDALKLLHTLIGKGAVGESAPKALVLAAQDGNLDAVTVLAPIVQDPAIYTNAFSAFTQSDSSWCRDDKFALLQLLLSHGSAGEELHSSLVDAISEVLLKNASVDLLTLLLQFGADVNYNDGKALQLVTKHGRLDLVELFLGWGPSATTLYMGLQEALCNNHDEEMVIALFGSITGGDEPILAKPDVNHDSKLGKPLIFYSLKHYPLSPDLAEKIIRMGADLNATIEWLIYQDESGLPAPAPERISPLLFAIQNQASDAVIVDILCKYGGADHNFVASQCQASALTLAAKMERPLVLSSLLDLGARVAQQDCFGRSALFYASRNGSLSAMTSLLKKRPPPNDGSLHEAARELHSDAVQMLVAAGHDVNFPSLKHGGRNALCELCYGCKVSNDLVALQNTLSECMTAKAAPLRKCRGRSALFFAIENRNPVKVVPKVIEVCLWRDLNHPSNVFEQDSHFYSATMYIKKGISLQPEKIALEVLDVLLDASAEDRYYAKERMQQPKGATGMPQRIADLDHKKWIRSSRLAEEQEDHEQRLQREMEEMNQRSQLSSSKHNQMMEQREDLAYQTINHNADAHWQGMQFRDMEQDQALRYKDQQLRYHVDDVVSTHRLRQGLDQQVRDAQLQYETQTAQQKMGFVGEEQVLRLDGAQAQQQLKLKGITAENELRSEQEVRDLMFRSARSTIERGDLDHKLEHVTNLNAGQILTNDRLEDIARESQRKRNDLEERGRQAQLGYQEASDDRMLRTEGAMNQHRLENNNNTAKSRFRLSRIEGEAMQNRHAMLETDRRNQVAFNAISDRQRLTALGDQGLIQNRAVRERGRIENNSLRERNDLVQQDRENELQLMASLGHVRSDIVASVGQQRIDHEATLGRLRLINEAGLNQERLEYQATSNDLRHADRIDGERSQAVAEIINLQARQLEGQLYDENLAYQGRRRLQ